jgi:hypothetical protein
MFIKEESMLEHEIENIEELKHMGIALVQYAKSIIDGVEFEQNGTRWVARPDNFVTFEPHWKRAKNIAVSLRGNPGEFIEQNELPLRSGMSGYSECKLTNVNQLAAASSYIGRAAELYQRGSTRTHTKPKVVE